MKGAGVLVFAVAASSCSTRATAPLESRHPNTTGQIEERRRAVDFRGKPVPEELTAEENARMDALPPPIVGPWCAGKLHSGGCVPGLEWTGVPSLTSSEPFIVRATRLKPNVPAFMFYGDVATATPYQGGMLCVGGTVHRLPAQDSGGSGSCGGSIEFDFNPLIRSGTDRSLVAGAKVFCQVQFRDDADPAGFGTGYSHALQFIIQP